MIYNKNRTVLGNLRYYMYLHEKKMKCNFCTLTNNKKVRGYLKWTMIENKFPWKNFSEHLILVLNRHIDSKDFEKLTPEEAGELIAIRKVYKDWFMGHPGWKTRKVDHMHIHLMR